MKNLNKLKKYEERVERVVEDPAKIIQIFKRIIEMGCCDLDGSRLVNLPVPDSQKVTFFEFVKYFGNSQLERAEENGWNLQEWKDDIIKMEEEIRKIDGFSSYELPDGLIIKYR